MKDGAMNMWDLPSAVFIDSGLGISVDVDFQSGGEIWFPVPAATFNRLSNRSYMNKIISPICLQDQGPALVNLQETLWN